MSLISQLFRCIDSCKTQNIDVLIEKNEAVCRIQALNGYKSSLSGKLNAKKWTQITPLSDVIC